MKKHEYVVRASNASTDHIPTNYTNFKAACKAAREWVHSGATNIDVVSFEDDRYGYSTKVHYQLKVTHDRRVHVIVKRNNEGVEDC